jgi:glycosyltransferase involved in cell wall biosynthesis
MGNGNNLESEARSEGPATAGRHVVIVASHAPSLTLFRGQLIRDLVGRGHKVTCFAPDFTPEAVKALADLGATTRDYALSRSGRNPLADMRCIRDLSRQLKALRPDVVMGYTPKPAIYASIAARLARVPRIVPMITGLGYAFIEDSGARTLALRAVMRRLYRLALGGSAAVIFHNQDDWRYLAAQGAVPHKLPVHVVSGSGVDLAHYGELPLPPIGAGLTFLMVARLQRHKGVVEYCRAAEAVRKVAPATKFLLVGPEDPGPAGMTAASLAPWRDSIEYLGPAADVRPHYARAHVFVLPSYSEGMPRTVLEAMAMGRPIITTDARGCRETVDERVNGCLVPVGDAGALADAMASFLRRPDLIPSMAKASRRKVERRFDVTIVNRAMIDILLGNPGAEASCVNGRVEDGLAIPPSVAKSRT